MNFKLDRSSGSVLVTAIIFGFALMSAVAGYVYLSTQSMKMANRTFHLNSAMNLAEAGLEEGLYALNDGGFADWDTDSDLDGDSKNDATRPFDTFLSNQNSEGIFTVIVTNYALNDEKNYPPKIIVRADSNIKNQDSPITKYVRASTKRGSDGDAAINARRGIRFVGNYASVNSFDSRLGPYEGDINSNGLKDSPDDVNLDGIVNRFANAKVASSEVGVDLGNADIWGSVATPGTDPNVGPNGTIADIGASQGTVIDGPDVVDSNGIITQESRVNRLVVAPDFNDIMEEIADEKAALLTSPLPNAIWAGIPTSDGAGWQVVPGSGGAVTYNVGYPDATTPLVISVTGNLNLGNKGVINVRGPVIFVVAGDIDGSGASSGIVIEPMDDLFLKDGGGNPIGLLTTVSPLKIYVGGNLTLTGQGLTNPYTIAGAAEIYGTAPPPTSGSTTGTQSITITGNGSFTGKVVAPNADLTLNGGGSSPDDFYGSFLGYSVTATGRISFHYDEALGESNNGRFYVRVWRELLTPTQRSTEAAGL